MGLQCGDSGRPARKIMLALDASTSTVNQALAWGADLLITHHPLLFEPLGPGNIHGPSGEAFARAVRGELAVYSAHTNLDASPRGINDSLAGIVGLTGREVLLPAGPDLFKVVVFLPQASIESVRDAAFEAGAGRIGRYSRCSFAAPGEGTFFGSEGARPVIGSPGRMEVVGEARLEVLVPEGRLAGVLGAVRRAHPYEEPAVDVIPLRGKAAGIGIGVVGCLPSAMRLGDLTARVKGALRLKAVRIVGSLERKVRKVAVCGGSGGSLLAAAGASGAELFISGDIKFHEARAAQERNLSILDVGHFAPERFGMLRFGELINGKFMEKGWDIPIRYAKEKDPFKTIV